MPGAGPQQHTIPRQDRLRPATANPVGESQQDHKLRYTQNRGVQLEKTGTSPGASCNNKVTSPR